jgi:hypothetical protein
VAKKGGLGKWFGEQWVDIKTGEQCGRARAEKSSRPYPACRPKAVASRMSSSQKKQMASAKTSSKRKNWPITSSGQTRTA